MYKTAHRSLVANADTPFAPPMSPTTADNLEPPKFPSPDDNVVNVVKFHEQNNGNIPMFVYRKESSEDVTQISFGQFIKAARLVLPMVAKVAAPSSGVVVAMIAQLDTLAYNAIELGLIIAGYIPFLISPRNTPAAIVHLLKSADCHHILTTHGTLKGLMENIQAELKESNLDYALSITEAPSFADLFPELTEGYRSDLNKPIFHTDNYDAPLGAPQDLMWESVALYLHSSGSTGLPKAIKKNHKQVRRAMAVFPSFSSFLEWSPRVRMLGVQLPPFHGMGSAITLMLPLFKCTTVALFPPVVTGPHMLPIAPTPDVTIEHIHGTKSTCTLTIPSFLQTWAEDKHALEVLKEMDSVSFGGGGLSPHAGAILRANGIRLCSVYGGTEIGGIASSSQREEDKDDWEYVEFLDITTPRWIPQGDGTYELQFLTNDVHAPSVENLTDARGYSTSDLFKPHPTKPGLWKIVGRIDDVIVHSSGEKTVPAPMEASLASSPLIHDAIIFGQGFDQPGVLIEPTAAHTFDTSDPVQVQVAKYRNLVWPAVEKANLLAPSFSRIFKEMILVANEAKPLPRAGKGTLLKKLALQIYKNEIEELYAATADAASAAQIDPPKSWDHNDVSSWIYENVMDITNGKIGSYTESFFDQGMDSLGATILRRRVASGLQTIKGAAGKRAFVSVTQSLIYNYPSVDALTSHILEILGDSTPTQPSKSHVDIVEEMIAKYSFSVQKTHNANSRKDGGTVVLLTGSTGYFGSQILEILLKDSRINKVYALNRPAKNVSILDRHIKRFQEKGLELSLLESAKLVLLEADYSKDDLGLDSSTYSELSSWVNIIIHTAWKLNFNHPLSSFEPNIRGTYNLIKFSRLGGHAEDIKFIFTSSVGVAQSWPAAAGGPYPNAVMPEAKYAVGKGYGEGKYVTERILANSGINAVSVRLGQITGSSENGAWAISDWVPILVKSSITLGALPSLHGSISWIPTDGAAGCILDLALHEGQYPTALNLVHHNPVSWATFVVYMKDALEKERQISLALIPFQEWMERLAHAAVTLTGKDIEKLPAIMLHDFFDGLARRDRESPRTDQTEAFGSPRFSTEEMKVISKSFQELPLLSPQHAQSWVHYWSLAGLFD